MKKKILPLALAGALFTAPAAAGPKKVAVFDFATFGQAQPAQGQDVADNVRLAFLASDSYKLETYNRMMNAVTAAANAGLDLSATYNLCRVGKALDVDIIVSGSVTCEKGTYAVKVLTADVATKEVDATYDGTGADLRDTAEVLMQRISGSQKFGVLFPDDVRDLAPPHDKETRDAISLVATPEELTVYDAVSSRGKSMMLDKFWLRRDPDASTAVNEYEREFWTRVAYAQNNFTTSIRDGIQTDLGKVYVVYGPPADIEDRSSGAGLTSIDSSTWSTEPYITWKYYGAKETGGRAMLFIFVDQDADGEYTIFASTEVGYGKRLATYREFDANRLKVDAEDTGEADDAYWDPARHVWGDK